MAFAARPNEDGTFDICDRKQLQEAPDIARCYAIMAITENFCLIDIQMPMPRVTVDQLTGMVKNEFRSHIKGKEVRVRFYADDASDDIPSTVH